MLAKNQMERRLKQRRSTSKLADLVEFVLSRPPLSTGVIQDLLHWWAGKPIWVSDSDGRSRPDRYG
jgi:hypothetical protein